MNRFRILLVTLLMVASAGTWTAVPAIAASAPEATTDGAEFTVETGSIQVESGGQICAERVDGDTNKLILENVTLTNVTIYQGSDGARQTDISSADVEGQMVLYTNGENQKVSTLALTGQCIGLNQENTVVEAYYITSDTMKTDHVSMGGGANATEDVPEPGGFNLPPQFNESNQQSNSTAPVDAPNALNESEVDNTTDEATKALNDTADRANDTVNQTTGQVNDTVDQTTDQVNHTVDRVTNETNETVDQTTDRVMNETNDTVDQTTDQVNNTVDQVSNETNDTVDQTTDQVTNETNDTVDQTTNQINDTTDGTQETVADTVDDTVNQTTDQVNDTVDDTTNTVDDTTDGTPEIATDTADDTTDGTTNTVTTAVNDTVETVSDEPDTISNTTTTTTETRTATPTDDGSSDDGLLSL